MYDRVCMCVCVCVCLYVCVCVCVCMCVGVIITTPSIVQNALVNVPAYSGTAFGNFDRFSNVNIFDAWLQPHIRHICPYGTRLMLHESVDRFSIPVTVRPLSGAKRITLTSNLRHLPLEFRHQMSQTYRSYDGLSKNGVEVDMVTLTLNTGQGQSFEGTKRPDKVRRINTDYDSNISFKRSLRNKKNK